MKLKRRAKKLKISEALGLGPFEKEKIITQSDFSKSCNLRFEKDFFWRKIKFGAVGEKKVELFESNWLESDHEIHSIANKMKAIPLLTICSACVLVSGCASDSTDYYLKDSFGFKEVCLVDNKNVPPSFFIALRQAIQDKGLQVRTVSKTEQSCPVTVYYEAKYNLAYLKDARLLMTTEGQPTDIVNLRKNLGPATLADPASDSEPKIRDMVNRLLPRGTPW